MGSILLFSCCVNGVELNSCRIVSIFSERLRELRGPSPQSQMAAELGMRQQQYARYENGVTIPGVDVLERICRVHDCSADWLLGLERRSASVTVNGSGNVVAAGTGAKAAKTVCKDCAKCPHKAFHTAVLKAQKAL